MKYENTKPDASDSVKEYDDDGKRRKSQIIDAVHESLRRLCGGSSCHRKEEELRELAQKSISLPNGGNAKEGGGKPHNIEIRIALTYFHRYRPRPSNKKKVKKLGQKQSLASCSDDNQQVTTAANEKTNTHFSGSSLTSDTGTRSKEEVEEERSLQIVSDLGLVRTISSALELAKLIVLEIEDILEGAGMDIQVAQPSGIICITTKLRSHYLRTVLGKLPCPHCTKWSNSIKGLWWHQQLEHNIHHSSAVDNAITEQDKLNNEHSLILYTPPTTSEPNQILRTDTIPIDSKTEKQQKNQNHEISTSSPSAAADDPIEIVKNNDLLLLKKLIVRNDINASKFMDKNGASLLHWAAGCGHVEIVKYLVEECNVNINQKQMGKRSFRNRTALHWAARNGHLPVVQYLFKHHQSSSDNSLTQNNNHNEKSSSSVLVDATTIDGTTAFCWASWQGHIHILQFLHEKGCNVNVSNSFGCNAILWAAQGNNPHNHETIQWLTSVGCNLYQKNTNGHGILHKSAQRGNFETCQWFFQSHQKHHLKENKKYHYINRSTNLMSMIEPDNENCCPSDLAGMEGHSDLAIWLSERESELVFAQERYPKWLQESIKETLSSSYYGDLNVWEHGGGVKRIAFHIVQRSKHHEKNTLNNDYRSSP